MPNEIVERVALAISGSADPANILEIHRSRARLAIEALRKPTDAMIESAKRPYTYGNDEIMNNALRRSIAGYWSAMIDEALK